MRITRVYANKIGLVFKEGSFLRTIGEGTHWLGFGESVQIFDKIGLFDTKMELNVLLQDEQLATALEIVEVKDTEFCLVFKNGNFFKVLYAGQYAFWKSVVNYDFKIVDTSNHEIAETFDRNLFKYTEIQYLLNKYAVQAYEAGLLIVDGKYIQKLGADMHYFWKNNSVVQVLRADLRKQAMEVSGQELLTKDKAAIRINFDLQYQIMDIEKALLDTKDVTKQLYLLMQMAIRAYIGTMTLDELLNKKTEIKAFVMEVAMEKAAQMGVELITCGIRDIILTGEVKTIMNKILIAEKTAQANSIMRREETAATRSLLNTAKLMDDNEMLFRLKEMEYIEKITEKVNAISLSGGGQLIEQLQTMFSVKK
jgi:regulator of protease activity HflC (stomatin/prohibitin superfamily)